MTATASAAARVSAVAELLATGLRLLAPLCIRWAMALHLRKDMKPRRPLYLSVSLLLRVALQQPFSLTLLFSELDLKNRVDGDVNVRDRIYRSFLR